MVRGWFQMGANRTGYPLKPSPYKGPSFWTKGRKSDEMAVYEQELKRRERRQAFKKGWNSR